MNSHAILDEMIRLIKTTPLDDPSTMAGCYIKLQKLARDAIDQIKHEFDEDDLDIPYIEEKIARCVSHVECAISRLEGDQRSPSDWFGDAKMALCLARGKLPN